MTSRDFCYWLQGYFEVHGVEDKGSVADVSLTPLQVDLIRRHLSLVFKHEIDPSYGPAEHQQELQDLHDGVKKAQETAEQAKKIASRPPRDPLIRC